MPQSAIFVVAAAFLWHAAAMPQSQPVRAPGAHLTTITPPNLRGTEPSIAVNPNNPGAGREDQYRSRRAQADSRSEQRESASGAERL